MTCPFCTNDFPKVMHLWSIMPAVLLTLSVCCTFHMPPTSLQCVLESLFMCEHVCGNVLNILSTGNCTCRYWNYLAKGRGRNGWRIDFFLVSCSVSACH